MELLDRYRKDQTPESLAAFLEAVRPLVASICRRYFRSNAEIDDAVQTVMVKLVRHVGDLRGGPMAWVSSAAHTTCVDLIRKAVSDRKRVDGLTKQKLAEKPRESEAARIAALELALKELGAENRRLIEERYFSGQTIRAIAAKKKTSMATMSRRVSGAIDELKNVLRRDVDVEAEYCGEHGLRAAEDWREVFLASAGAKKRVVVPGGGFRAGWTRKIRVGAMVSHIGATTLSSQGFYFRIENQLAWAGELEEDGFEFVSIVEPATSQIGHIERAVRDFELTGGLIEGTDRAGLETLDVIVLPPVFAVRSDVLKTIVQAVESGVGLYNQWWMGSMEGRADDEWVKRTMLSSSAIGTYHAPQGHSWPLPATVHEEHEIVRGLSAGEQLLIAGCGPFYRPAAGARMLISKDELVEIAEVKEVGRLRVPVLLIGAIGKGRVVVDHQGMPAMLSRHSKLSGGFTANVLEWLAAGRREIET